MSAQQDMQMKAKDGAEADSRQRPGLAASAVAAASTAGARWAGPQHSALAAHSLALNAGHSPAATQFKAPVQRAPNRTGMPDALKAGVETLSGISMDPVRVHYNSAKPAQLNAYAYAQGSEIHLGPGQEKHLPHEAWHVVQQAQGRVKPTLQMKGGVGVNDDLGMEREADLMGLRADLYSTSPLVSSRNHGAANGARMASFNTTSITQLNGALTTKQTADLEVLKKNVTVLGMSDKDLVAQQLANFGSAVIVKAVASSSPIPLTGTALSQISSVAKVRKQTTISMAPNHTHVILELLNGLQKNKPGALKDAWARLRLSVRGEFADMQANPLKIFFGDLTELGPLFRRVIGRPNKGRQDADEAKIAELIEIAKDLLVELGDLEKLVQNREVTFSPLHGQQNSIDAGAENSGTVINPMHAHSEANRAVQSKDGQDPLLESEISILAEISKARAIIQSFLSAEIARDTKDDNEVVSDFYMDPYDSEVFSPMHANSDVYSPSHKPT